MLLRALAITFWILVLILIAARAVNKSVPLSRNSDLPKMAALVLALRNIAFFLLVVAAGATLTIPAMQGWPVLELSAIFFLGLTWLTLSISFQLLCRGRKQIEVTDHSKPTTKPQLTQKV